MFEKEIQKLKNLKWSKSRRQATFTYKWTIANYGRLYDEDCRWKWRICSNEFSAPNNEEFQFEICLNPKEFNKEDNKYFASIGVRAFNIPTNYENKKIKCHWNVKIEGEDRCERGVRKKFDLFHREWKFVNFFGDQKLLNCPSQLAHTEMTLIFEINMKAKKRIFNVITNHSAGESRFDCQRKVIEVEHTWTINNFTDMFNEETVAPYFIQSGHFPAVEEQSERFCLRLCPYGWSQDSKDNVEIFVWNSNEERATVHYDMSILDVDGDKWNPTADTEKIPPKYGRHFGHHRRYILNKLNGLVHDNKLKIFCKMSYMMDSNVDNETVDRGPQILNTPIKSKSNFDVARKTIHYVEKKYGDDESICLNSRQDGDSINLPEIKLPTDTRVKLHLSLSPNGHDEHSNRYLSLELHNVSENLNQVTAQYRISIVDANGYKWNRWGDQSTMSSKGSVKRSKFFLQSQFQNPSLISHYLPDGKLTIVCELWIVQDRKIYKTKPSNTQSQVTSPSGTTNVHISNSSISKTVLNVHSESYINDFNKKLKN